MIACSHAVALQVVRQERVPLVRYLKLHLTGVNCKNDVWTIQTREGVTLTLKLAARRNSPKLRISIVGAVA